MGNSRILLIDIETSPILGFTWELRETDVIKRVKGTEILSFAYKWLGGTTRVEACDTQTERQLLRKVHSLLSEADIVVAQNGDAFDIKKINSRLIVHRFDPPSPYRTVDTLKVARAVGAFDSNSLNNLGVDLSEGEKIKHRGFDMWEGCMKGNRRDWADMKRYNKKDVDLLERVYLRLRAWMKNHPAVSVGASLCPACGAGESQRRGWSITKHSRWERRQCNQCATWFKGEKECIAGTRKV